MNTPSQNQSEARPSLHPQQHKVKDTPFSNFPFYVILYVIAFFVFILTILSTDTGLLGTAFELPRTLKEQGIEISALFGAGGFISHALGKFERQFNRLERRIEDSKSESDYRTTDVRKELDGKIDGNRRDCTSQMSDAVQGLSEQISRSEKRTTSALKSVTDRLLAIEKILMHRSTLHKGAKRESDID